MKRDAVVVTSNRIVLYRPGMLGRINFEDYSWQDVQNVHMKQGMLGSEITLSDGGRTRRQGHLPRQGAVQAVVLAGPAEGARVAGEAPRAPDGGVKGCRWWRRRACSHRGSSSRGVGRARARTGREAGVKLESMLDAGLISESEYESIKAKIISSMT